MSKNNGQINLAFLSAIDADTKAAIIDSIANDYGKPTGDIWEEVTANDAHDLLDYMKEPHRGAALTLMRLYGFGSQGATKSNQKTIIKRIQGLCNELKHSEAIALTNEICDPDIAVKAHLLCMEHEQRCRLDGKLPKTL